jgi:hypothetical protein
MNKKILSLLFLLILLVSVTISYAYINQPTTQNSTPTDSDGTITEDTLTSEIDSTFLDEDQGIEIGDML